MKTINIRVHGDVQGVGFRYYTQRHASDHSVKGWVRNQADGSVEILAQGTETQLRHFLHIIEKGPAYANVSRLDVEDVESQDIFKDFRVTF